MSKNDEDQGIDSFVRHDASILKYIRGWKQILLVDDDIDEITSISNLLSRCNYRVFVSVNPHEALKVFREQPEMFDLIITDLKMPGMQGDKLLSLARQVREDIPVIVCSGSEKALYELKKQGLDIQEYLLKPFSCSSLLDTVKRWVG